MTLCSCLPVSAPTNFSDMRIWCCYWTRFLSFSYILKKKKLMYIFSLSFYIDWRSETKVGCGDTNSKIVCVYCIFFCGKSLTFWPFYDGDLLRTVLLVSGTDLMILKRHRITLNPTSFKYIGGKTFQTDHFMLWVYHFFFFSNRSNNNLIILPTPTKSISPQCWYANSICFQKTRNPNWLGYITYLQKLLKTTGRESNAKHNIKWWVKKKNIITVKKGTMINFFF